MTASGPQQTDQLVRTFTAQLRRSGVAHVVIAPGSRSTPLTLAFARDPEWTSWLHLDERSAGYFALGLARQLRAPVALVCTSGTAAANFAPAVAEASLSRIPLIVLTADRPPELRDIGANQTIDQAGVYASHPKATFQAPIADGTDALLRWARTAAARAASLATEAPAGPVHLNFPFREPLTDPAPPLPLLPPADAVDAPAAAPLAPTAETVARLAALCGGRRGLIYCGPEPYGLPAAAIVRLAAALGWPVLAEPLSGVRAGLHALDHVIDAYDPLLRSARFATAAAPEVVLRFGAAPTSRGQQVLLAARPGLYEIVVDGAGGWRDPDGTAHTMVHADAGAFCDALTASVAAVGGRATPPDVAWLVLWLDANAAARAALRDALDATGEPFEGRAPVELAEALPDGATLVVGNSMPVRDMEAFFPALPRDVRIVGTRGASGIDGVVSTAVGAAAARVGPVALLIGDLSFFHDLNGLWPLRRHGLSLTVLLVNNNGGGIFHFLAQAEDAREDFEQWFGTSHGLDFAHAVALHGGRYELLEGNGGWAPRIAQALARDGLDVLEVRTDRVSNVPSHRAVWLRVETAVGVVLDART